MAGERETKLCRFCYEGMDARAKRCPHCRMVQTRWAWSYHPAVWAAFAGLCLLALVAPTIQVLGRPRRNRDFAKYQDQLEVLNSDIIYGESGMVLGIVGEIRNNSDIPWESLRVEVLLRDENGRLVDVLNDRLHMNEIAPGTTGHFSTWDWPYLPPVRYASHEVRIVWAEDTAFWW